MCQTPGQYGTTLCCAVFLQCVLYLPVFFLLALTHPLTSTEPVHRHTQARARSRTNTLHLLKQLGPRPDLVPAPGHCALALKGMLFRQGAQNHFLAVCIYNSNRFVDRLTAATSNRRETWVKKHGTDGILCRQVPVPGYGA